MKQIYNMENLDKKITEHTAFILNTVKKGLTDLADGLERIKKPLTKEDLINYIDSLIIGLEK